MIRDTYKIPLKGNVRISVTRGSETLRVVDNHNAVIVDILRTIIAQLVPKGTSSSSIIQSQGRPTISLGNIDGPDNRNTLAYIRIGYSLTGSQISGATTTDTSMFNQSFDTIKVSSCICTDTSITITASKNVSEADSLKYYTEVGLYTPGELNLSVPESPTPTGMRMMAHQVHSAIRAPQGSVIEYEWTLLFQE